MIFHKPTYQDCFGLSTLHKLQSFLPDCGPSQGLLPWVAAWAAHSVEESNPSRASTEQRPDSESATRRIVEPQLRRRHPIGDVGLESGG